MPTIQQLRELTADAILAGELFCQVEAVHSKETRDGKPYHELVVADAGGNLTLRVWSDHPEFKTVAALKPLSFIAVNGRFYLNGNFGPDARQWTLRPLDHSEIALLLAGPEELRQTQDQDYSDILGMTEEIADPRLRSLCGLYLEKYGDRFRRTAAARNYHHARRGGLVEHVAQMMRSARAIATVYTELNTDLLLAGALFHDSGKLWENVYPEQGFVMAHHEAGELLGHIVTGIELVNKLWRDLLESPDSAEWQNLQPASEDVRLHLLHLLAAHHGELEFGSPVTPRTPEAAALHYIDNLDAKLEMFRGGYKKGTPLAARIFERVRPLPGNLVTPLKPFSPQILEETPPDANEAKLSPNGTAS